MFEADFTHEGDRCTFEVLLERFALADPALVEMAKIVRASDTAAARLERKSNQALSVRAMYGFGRTHVLERQKELPVSNRPAGEHASRIEARVC